MFIPTIIAILSQKILNLHRWYLLGLIFRLLFDIYHLFRLQHLFDHLLHLLLLFILVNHIDCFFLFILIHHIIKFLLTHALLFRNYLPGDMNLIYGCMLHVWDRARQLRGSSIRCWWRRWLRGKLSLRCGLLRVSRKQRVGLSCQLRELSSLYVYTAWVSIWSLIGYILCRRLLFVIH